MRDISKISLDAISDHVNVQVLNSKIKQLQEWIYTFCHQFDRQQKPQFAFKLVQLLNYCSCQIILQNQGDILLTAQTASRLIPVSPLSNDKYSAALINTTETLWTENKQAGYYIIGYIINDRLNALTKQTIPKVMISGMS